MPARPPPPTSKALGTPSAPMYWQRRGWSWIGKSSASGGGFEARGGGPPRRRPDAGPGRLPRPPPSGLSRRPVLPADRQRRRAPVARSGEDRRRLGGGDRRPGDRGP